MVHCMNAFICCRLLQYFFVCLQAGTYIKEFVHSDEGRTQPHLASLLGLSTSAAILQLDVNQIHIDFLQQ